MNELKLSILEFGQMHPPKVLSHQVINNLFEDVSLYDEWGYRRLWLSEHYSPEFAWFNPEMILPLLAGYSEKIKIGMAGVLLSYHSPLLVAQNFKILSSIYADRIDLGLARAFVPDNTSIFLISKDEIGKAAENWDYKVSELFSFLTQWDREDSLIKNMPVPPHGTKLPDMWFLGTSDYSLASAVINKANFCLSLMHPNSNLEKNADTIKRFKGMYFDKHNELPQTSVLLATGMVDSSALIEGYNVQFNKNSIANPFGEKDFIMDHLVKLQMQLENDEFVLYTPVLDREKKLKQFEQIIRG